MEERLANIEAILGKGGAGSELFEIRSTRDTVHEQASPNLGPLVPSAQEGHMRNPNRQIYSRARRDWKDTRQETR
jgi:hypothetical protein